MKIEENFVENLVALVPKLFGNEIVWHRNVLQWNWRWRNCSSKKFCSPNAVHTTSVQTMKKTQLVYGLIIHLKKVAKFYANLTIKYVSRAIFIQNLIY